MRTLTATKPFEEQLTRFYAAPLAPAPASVIVVLSLAAALFETGPHLLAVLVHMILVIAVWAYGLRLLQRFSFGDLDLNSYVADEERDRDRVFKVIGALMLVAGALTTLARAAPALSWVFYTILIFVAPAIVMQCAVRESLAEALRLDQLWRLVSSIGPNYWWLLAMGTLMLSSSRLFSWSIGELAGDGFMSRLLDALVSNYTVLVLCCMMGYAVFEKAEQLGIATRSQRRARLMPRRVGAPAPEGSVNDLLGQGDVEGALVVAAEQSRLGINDPAAQERYVKLLSLRGDESKLVIAAGRWLVACAMNHRADKCATIVKDWWVRYPQILDESPERFLNVAQLALQGGAAHEALQMTQYFQRVHRGSMLTPQLVLLEAKILLTHRNDPERARQRLLELIAAYPSSASEIAEATALLCTVDGETKPRQAAPPMV